jgi:riboflavin kinase/FMN adenylyltransferase
MGTEAGEDPTGVLVARGTVQRGDQRGRTIGFPTVNLVLEGDVLRDGVWAGWMALDDERFPVAISVGGRPTFYGSEGQRLLEAHVLDFDQDIYGRVVTVWLCHHIRTQCRFDGIDALKTQLEQDVAECRAWAQANNDIWRSWLAESVPEGTVRSLSPAR